MPIEDANMDPLLDIDPNVLSNSNTVSLSTGTPVKFKRKQTFEDTPTSRHVDKKAPMPMVDFMRTTWAEKQEKHTLSLLSPSKSDLPKFPTQTKGISDERTSHQKFRSQSPLLEEIPVNISVEETEESLRSISITSSNFRGETKSPPVDKTTDQLMKERDTSHNSPRQDDTPDIKPHESPQNLASDIEVVGFEPLGPTASRVITTSIPNKIEVRRSQESLLESSPIESTEQSTRTNSTELSGDPNSIEQSEISNFQVPIDISAPIDNLALKHKPMTRNMSMETPQKRNSTRTPGTIAKISEEDLLYFQTPASLANRYEGNGNHSIFRNDIGEEMLVDITPRVYSPRSIPIYTIQDVESVKADFQRFLSERDDTIKSLTEKLANSIPKSDHQKSLTLQAESLHLEYSKKHVRKVTALKSDWEKKAADRTSTKDARIKELESSLEKERLEKKEIIEMGEQILSFVNAQAP